MVLFGLLLAASILASSAQVSTTKAFCESIDPWVSDQWCMDNCNHKPAFCPPFLCYCKTAYCLHETDVPSHKCYEACSTGTQFHTRGFNSTGRCDRNLYNIKDVESSVYQCPDGVTNVKYCKDTALNITIATYGIQG